MDWFEQQLETLQYFGGFLMQLFIFVYELQEIESGDGREEKPWKIAIKRLNVTAFNEVDNALKRLPIWAHQTLNDTNDPFLDDFADDIVAPAK